MQKLEFHLPSDLYAEIESYIRSEGLSFEAFALWSLSEKVGEIRERRQVKNLKYLKPALQTSSSQQYLSDEKLLSHPIQKSKSEELPVASGPKRLLNAKEVAKILGISSSKVYNMIQAREIPVISLGRNVRIREEDMEEFIIRQRRQT